MVNYKAGGRKFDLDCPSLFMFNIGHLACMAGALKLKLFVMATISLYLDTRRAKKDGRYPVKLNVRHRRNFLMPTDFDADLASWDGNQFGRKEPNWKTRNAMLRNLISRVEDMLEDLDKSGRLKRMTDAALKSHILKSLKGGHEEQDAFLRYFDEFAGKKAKKGTKAVYQDTRNKVVAFDPDCTLAGIDKEWLEDFDRWMEGRGMKTNSRSIHLRNIRAVFNYCIDEEYTSLYPFRKFKIKSEETRKRSLTLEQLRSLKDFPVEEYQEKYRDIFMLMFYLIGINAADLFRAKKKDVVNGRLEYKRAKTGRLYSVKIEPEAQEIIDKYAGEGDYLLNVLDSYANYKDFLHRMNLGLQQIGGMERVGRGGKKVREPAFPGVSSYWTRHTWATLAASLDIPKETISEALGHSFGLSVTSIYIQFDRRKVDEANRRVIDLVNGKVQSSANMSMPLSSQSQ